MKNIDILGQPLGAMSRALPKSAVRDVAESIGRRIASGVYQPGEVIPLERELAEQHEVSRTVLREAIKVLSGKGMLRTARRHGTRVTPSDDWTLLDPDVISWLDPMSQLAREIYRDATELRVVIEPEAAALAARHASAEQVAAIRDAARILTPTEADREALLHAEYVFHCTLLDASGNKMIKQFRELTRAVLSMTYRADIASTPEEKSVRDGHLKVADAIAAGKAKSARAEMRRMLQLNVAIAERLGVQA